MRGATRMKAKRSAPLARHLARGCALAILGASLTLLASCSSLFGFDDYNDGAADLCDLAEKCYDFSACQSHVAPKLDSAAPEVRSEWLAAIPGKSCLANCAKSRKCLNLAPVCSQIFDPCEREEECCGFLGGKARCRPLANASAVGDAGGAGPDAGGTTANVCCLPDGVQTSDATSCCSGIYNPKNKACGTNVCRPEGTDCTDDLQCCSQICRDGKCSEEQCLPLDTPCSPTDRCCDGAECISGACGFQGECRTLRAPCNTKGSAQCCVGLECQAAVNKHPTTEVYEGLCQQPPDVCMPKGYGCESATCCTGLSCRNGECKPPCDKVDAVCSDNGDCCSGKCEVTNSGPVCVCAQIYCDDQNDCCSGICVGGVCTSACAQTTLCHDECVPGPPLVETDLGQCTEVVPSCVASVCAQDKYCCCVEWDATCVKLAVTTCKATVCN